MFPDINDLLSLDMLQKLQDNFSDATGLALVAVNASGEPITKPSGFSPFCLMFRSSKNRQAQCFECDNAGGRKALQVGEPIFYRCGCGLAEFAVPIDIEGHYLGALLSGQVKISDQDLQGLNPILDETTSWQHNKQLIKLYDEIKTVSFEKFKAAAYTLYHLTHYLVDQGYTSVIKTKLHEQTLELLNESRSRIELEKLLQEADFKALSYQINPHFLFNVLNTIGRLALLENAEKTEAMVYGFSDMMRYILRKNNNKLITIETEINHISNYLSLQKVRMGDKFTYSISIPEKHYKIPCPFMTIQPIIENFFKYVVEPREEISHIAISGFESNNDAIIKITDNGDGMPLEMIELALKGNLKRSKNDGLGIFNVSERLKLSFGDNYGLQIESSFRKGEGITVLIRCPLVESTYQADT